MIPRVSRHVLPRRVLSALALPVLLLGGVRGASAQGSAATPPRPSIAVVDSRLLLEGAPGIGAAERALERDLDALRRLAAAVEDSAQARLAVFERQAAAPAVPEARRAALQRSADSVVTGARERLAALDRQAAARREAVLAPFLAAVREAIEAERAAMGVALVFDLASDDQVLAAAPALDLTDRVAARLRTRRIEWPATPAAVAPAPATRATVTPATGGAGPAPR